MERMTSEQAAEAAKGLTFEKVWASLMELRDSQQESQQETQRQLHESQQKMEKIVADLSKNIGGLNNSLGRFTEAMFVTDLWRKFNELGYTFTRQAPRMKFFENGQVLAEADFFLENGLYAMLVEIKTDLTTGDVDDHIERIEKIRQYLDKHDDNRKLIGAVAGGIVSESVIKYA